MAGAGIARETVSSHDPGTPQAGVLSFSAAKVESIVETTFDSLVVLNAGDVGKHGVEKPVEPPGTLSGCACAIAKPSAAMSAKPNAKLANLRTMARSEHPPGRAVQLEVPMRRLPLTVAALLYRNVGVPEGAAIRN